ncbi:hypothetical protein MSM1_17585 [Mycobacterium sp. SM1]|uniref:hypothetical protein n=1 Tax=Mycobacterium sp. SM1 TaxID=2816243 RepID=UPI001BD0ECEF|nr:hypothetical protein [Mycobacterium sp. SM1]MBS4730071.1 hypothetical protein [Mycobacterium sp. SM1]
MWVSLPVARTRLGPIRVGAGLPVEAVLIAALIIAAAVAVYVVAAAPAGLVMGVVALGTHGWHVYQRHRASRRR